MWKATGAAAMLGASASGWLLWRDYQTRNRLPFPPLTPSRQTESDAFFLYLSERGQPDSPLVSRLLALSQPVFSLDKSNFPTDWGLKLNKEADVYYVRKIGGKLITSQLDSYMNEKIEKWAKIHLQPVTELHTKAEFEEVLNQRKKSAFLDNVIVAHVPDAESEAAFREIVDNILYEDPVSHVLSTVAKQHLHFYAIKDKRVAAELGMESHPGKLAVYRFRDARGLFDIRSSKMAYTSQAEFAKYAETHLRNSFKISVNTLQLDLHIFCDCYLLDPSKPTELPRATTAYSTKAELAQALATVDPLICPVWSPKDLQLLFMRLTKYIVNHPEGKLLVISMNDSKEERNFNDLPSLLRQMQLEEIARDNPDLLILVGSPQMLYHLPLRDFALFHFQDIEVRLMQLKEAKVARAAYYDGSAPLNEWMQNPEWGPESAPFYQDSYSKAMLAEELKSEVLEGDQCYFMMYCSSTCGSCNYQLPYFEEAARLNKTPCKFGKYNIANQSPYFKGPNATPTYLLYTPKGKKTPVQYEPRKLGLTPEAMHSFITSELAKSSV